MFKPRLETEVLDTVDVLDAAVHARQMEIDAVQLQLAGLFDDLLNGGSGRLAGHCAQFDHSLFLLGTPVRFILWIVANGAPSVVEVVARPSAVRHSVHDFVAHPGVYHGLLKDPHGIAVAEVVRVLGLIALDVEIAYAHCDELQSRASGSRNSPCARRIAC